MFMIVHIAEPLPTHLVRRRSREPGCSVSFGGTNNFFRRLAFVFVRLARLLRDLRRPASAQDLRTTRDRRRFGGCNILK